MITKSLDSIISSFTKTQRDLQKFIVTSQADAERIDGSIEIVRKNADNEIERLALAGAQKRESIDKAARISSKIQELLA